MIRARKGTTTRNEVATMFLRILKKDLKRKKTMNVIMLLFVILSAMFASAAVNNVAAVTNGIDYYFKISDVPDAMISVDLESEECKKIEALPSVTETRKEKGLLSWIPCAP